MLRQIVLDTETTGLETEQDHRIIEIGCVEIIDRRLTGNNYHCYINPERVVDEGAREVHGLDEAFLADKPVFREIAQEFLDFIRDSELIIHNAPFDVGFINHEFARLEGYGTVTDYCKVTDSLKLARDMHPGQKNSLDALCRRYGVDNSNRTLHGALLDAEILADVFLVMTGGQTSIGFDSAITGSSSGGIGKSSLDTALVKRIPVLLAHVDEQQAHEAYLDMLAKASSAESLWKQLE